jgi:hypothetical protein
MALLATQEIPVTGLQATYSAVSASDTFVPDDRTFLNVKNAGGSPDVVAVVTPRTAAGGLAIADVSVSVTNAQERFIGPFPAEHFADPTTGLATVTHSFTTTVTVAVVRVPSRT